MAYLNKIQLIGNLGSEPKIKVTSSGRKVASLAIATDDGYFDKNSNKWVENTTWHNVNAWGPLAERIEKKSYSKGTSMYVEGSYRSRKWDDNGTSRTSYEVLAVDVKSLEKPANSQQQPDNRSPRERQQGAPQQYTEPAYNENDDLPF